MVFRILSLPVPRLSDNLTCSPIFSIQSWKDVPNLGSIWRIMNDNDSSNKPCQFWSRKPQQSPACSIGGTPASHQHSFKVDIPVVRPLSFLCNRTKSNLPTKKDREQFINTISHTYTILFLLFPSFPQALKPPLHRYNGRLRCPGPWRTATTPRPPRAARAGPAAPRGSSAARSRTAPRSATAWPRPRRGCSGGWGGVDAVDGAHG